MMTSERAGGSPDKFGGFPSKYNNIQGANGWYLAYQK